ncbi:MAG: glycoside hydrolase [Acidobacteriota bacterium]|nr:glycoside hydrolase [Acidobacteriota bacterium]
MLIKKSLIGAAICVAVGLLSLNIAAQPKRFYIAPDDHTDYFWTADDTTYRQAFLTMLDYYLNKMDATQNNASDNQMRWSCDGSLWMWEFEKNRSPAQFDRFINRVRDGHLSVPLNPLVLVNGGAPAEAVLRGMYYPGLIERRYNVRFPMAIAMENQGFPYGLSSLWAGAGAKYSWKGVCGCATNFSQLGNRDREIYYSGGRDGSKVLMKWHSLFGSNQSFGGYAEAFDALGSINFAENSQAFQAKYPFPVIGAFGRGWDGLQYTSDEFVSIAQQNSNANRRVIVSNEEDFFRDFEANYGSGLETNAAAYGNEWDALVASLAEVSARVKRGTEKLRTADALAALVSVNNPNFMTSSIAERDRAMLDMGLYFEHTWTADGAVPRTTRANWSRRVEGEITAYVDKLDSDARAELGGQISRDGAEQRFFVFNPLSWTRSDFADLPFRQNRRVRVFDVTNGAEVPSQIVRIGNRKVLRVAAENVPSIGYKVYEVRGGSSAASPMAATASGNVIENDFYRLTLAGDGAITSLIDKQRGNREIVRTINGRVLNDLGGNRAGRVFVENAGAASVTLRADSSSPLEHTTRVTFYRNSNRVDIENQIRQNFGDVKTWSFSFDINSPDVWHEEVGAVIRGKLTTDGGHYSPKNARYDWLTMNHFADIADGAANNFGVTVSNADAYFMKLGESGNTTLDTATPQINVLSGGQIDGSGLGIPNQGGDSFFTQRFALQTHAAFDQTAAMKFALEHQNPLAAGLISGAGTQARPFPANNYSFVTISNPNVLLWTLKPAEDGIARGIVARVWNQSNAVTNYTLGLGPNITAAEKVTHIETFIENATVSGGRLNANINQQQIQTHLLKIGN